MLWYGNNFHPDLNEGVVYYQAFNGNYQYPIVAATVNNGALEFKFPELVDLRNTDVIDNTVTVTIKIGRTFSLSKQLVVKAPEVHSFSPLEVNNVFDEIKINGKNFGINPSVSLKGENLDIISSNGSQIVASIPATWVKNINISEFMSDSIIVTNDNNRITGSFVPFTFNYNCCAWARMDNMNGRYDNRKYYKSWSNNGYGYILGGVTGSNPYSLTYYDEFWQYDPISDDWTRLKDIPTTPSSQGKNAVFVHNDQTYVLLGGPEYSLMRYDQNNDTWTRLKDPPNFASITYNFNIDNRQFILLRSNLNVYEYKFDLDEWVIVSAMPESTIFYSYPHNGKQIVGFWGSKEYEFSPNTLSWTELRTTTYDYQIEILEDNSNHYLYDKYGNDHSLYLYEPSSNTKIIESEFPNTSDSNLYLFSIGGKHYFRNIEFVKYDPTFN